MAIRYSSEGLEFMKFIVATCRGKEGVPWLAGLGHVLARLEPGEDLYAELTPRQLSTYQRWPLIVAIEKAIRENEGDDVAALLTLFASKEHFDKTLAEMDMDAREFPEELRPVLHTIHYVSEGSVKGEYCTTHAGHMLCLKGLLPLGRRARGLRIVHLAGTLLIDRRHLSLIERLHDELAMDPNYTSVLDKVHEVDYTGTELRSLTKAAADELGL